MWSVLRVEEEKRVAEGKSCRCWLGEIEQVN